MHVIPSAVEGSPSTQGEMRVILREQRDRRIAIHAEQNARHPEGATRPKDRYPRSTTRQFSRNAAIGVSANSSRPVSRPIATASEIIATATRIAGANAGTNDCRKMKW